MDLMRRDARESKHPGFKDQLVEHLDVMYGTALRLTRAEAEAEDLVQDTLVKAHRFQDKFEPGSNLRAWLLRILTNTFINRYRRGVRERQTLEGHMSGAVGDGVMSRAAMRALQDPVSVAQERLLASEIRSALDDLPDDYRLVVELADVQELSYREISEVIGCPIGTVMSRLHRARKAMQARLIEQAVSMGIVASAEVDEVSADAPVQLEAFRRRKQGAA